jgi:hypothetical protein
MAITMNNVLVDRAGLMTPLRALVGRESDIALSSVVTVWNWRKGACWSSRIVCPIA